LFVSSFETKPSTAPFHRVPQDHISLGEQDSGRPKPTRSSAFRSTLLYPPDAAQDRVMDKLKVAVTGAAGRMGRELIRTVHANDNCVLAGAIEQEGSLALGQDAGLL